MKMYMCGICNAVLPEEQMGLLNKDYTGRCKKCRSLIASLSVYKNNNQPDTQPIIKYERINVPKNLLRHAMKLSRQIHEVKVDKNTFIEVLLEKIILEMED